MRGTPGNGGKHPGTKTENLPPNICFLMDDLWIEVKMRYADYKERIEDQVEHTHKEKFSQTEKEALNALYKKDKELSDLFKTIRETFKQIEERKLDIYDEYLDILKEVRNE